MSVLRLSVSEMSFRYYSWVSGHEPGIRILTSTVVNLAEKARQRAMLRHGGGGAPTALSPQNTRPWESSTWSTSTWANSQSAGLGFYMVLFNPCLLPFWEIIQ